MSGADVAAPAAGAAVRPFALPELDEGPVPVVLVGAGLMGRNWLRMLSSSPLVRLTGIVDLDVELARRVSVETGFEGVEVGPDAVEIAARTGAKAVIDVTVPAAHHPVNTAALFAGLPVLCEKPIAPTVGQALSLAAAAEASGQLLMTSQSRRYYDALAAFRTATRSLGRVGTVAVEFFKAPHFPGFREEMDHPLLVDMAIHTFDAVRYLVDADPVSVYCDAFNPGWSWFRGAASASAVFELTDGVRFSYTGSWCAPGLETSWNGSWRVSGEHGTATWDGEGEPVAERPEEGAGPRAVAADPADRPGGREIAGALAEFVGALRTGTTPSGEVHSNVLSLAMVEAAVVSADGGERVRIADVLEAAYGRALADERRPEVRARLEAWGSAAAGLGFAG